MKKSQVDSLLERAEFRHITAVSAWSNGVALYAIELLEALREHHRLEDVSNAATFGKALLNGALNWHDYSWGGCALIYDGDIAERLCTPSELKRKRGGELPPNSHEAWLDVQARALYQAAILCECLYSTQKGK